MGLGYFMPSILRLIDIPLELPDHPPILFLHRLLPSKQMGQDVLALGVAGGSPIFPFTLAFPNFKLWLLVTHCCNSLMVP